MQRKGLGALAAALAIASAGCGGGSERTGAAFTRQVDAICKANRTSDARLWSNAKAARSTPKAMAQFVLTIVARDEAKVVKLAAIDPPDALEGDYETYLRALRAENKLQRDVVRLAPPSASGDIAPGTAAAEADREHTAKAHEAFDRAQALGFKVCGA